MSDDDSEKKLVLDAVIGPTSEAYYSDRVRSSSSARNRAQTAQSTTTVLIGGLVGTFTVTNLSDKPQLLEALGFTAVILWILAGMLYLRAVSSPTREVVEARHVNSRLELIDHVLKKMDNEVAQIEKRQRFANIAVVAAAGITLSTVGLFLFGDDSKFADGTIALSGNYTMAIQKVCPFATQILTGSIDRTSVNSQFATIKVPGAICGDQAPITLYVPRSEIITIVAEGK